MYNYHGKQFKTAQDLQDEIFCNMSVDKRIKVASGLWQLGKAINSDKIDYRKIYARFDNTK